jgi:hypothetical protein
MYLPIIFFYFDFFWRGNVGVCVSLFLEDYFILFYLSYFKISKRSDGLSFFLQVYESL